MAAGQTVNLSVVMGAAEFDSQGRDYGSWVCWVKTPPCHGGDDEFEPHMSRYELPSLIASEMVSTIPCGIVRHVHSAATPLDKVLRHTLSVIYMRLWRVGTNTLHILRTTGSWFVRFVVQPSIYSFQCSD